LTHARPLRHNAVMPDHSPTASGSPAQERAADPRAQERAADPRAQERAADPRAQERAMLLGIVLDIAITFAQVAAAIWANSLSMLAELLRAIPLIGVECVLLVLMRRINQGKLTAYDYGTRKVEQFANLLAGITLVFAAMWLLSKLAARYGVPQEQPTLGLAFAALVAFANLTINVTVFVAIWRAARGGQSLILNGQILVRLSKVIASALVAIAIAVNAVFGSEGIGAVADLVGTAVVILVMVLFGGQMVLQAMPHLVDRTLGEQQQQLINRALAERFEDFDDLLAVRTRTEGSNAWIEIELGFAPDRRVGEAARAADRIAAQVRDLVPGAQVLVVIREAAG
jgi:divalent metal cation (Fe/Co/Zn/Cd) transporter